MPATAAFPAILAARVAAIRESGPQWVCKCPAHDDRRQSLAVRVNAGRILLHCHAGCSVERILSALQLSISDMFLDRKKPRMNIKETYDYKAANGRLLYQVCRMEPKDFRGRRPDGKGEWIWNLEGVSRVPYNLPAVVEQAQKGRTVWIVEGEKDANRLNQIGLVATTNAGGAGKWQAEYAQFLKGAHCVLLPDNDEPGQQHMLQVAMMLASVTQSVRVVNLPDLPEKGDVSDWLDARLRGNGGDIGETRGALVALAKATPALEKPPTQDDALRAAIVKAASDAIAACRNPFLSDVELSKLVKKRFQGVFHVPA